MPRCSIVARSKRGGNAVQLGLAALAVAGAGAAATTTLSVHGAAGATGATAWHVTRLPAPPGSSYAEPGIAVGSDGTMLVDAATANTGAQPVFWIARGPTAAWEYGRDLDTSGVSTGDADVAVGPDGYMYALNLAYSPSPPQQPANPTVVVSRSPDGRHWLGPASFPLPHGLDQPDRPWLVVSPTDPADVDVVNSEGGGNIVMWRSVDHAASFSGPIPVTGGVNSEAALALGSRPLVQPNDGRRMYMLYETSTPAGAVSTSAQGPTVGEFPMSQLWLSASTDGGATWTNHEVLDTATGIAVEAGTVGHLLVASAIDGAGNLYAAFALRPAMSTRTHIEFMHSTDQGATWSTPVAVTSAHASNVMPALAVSHDGTAYLSWYASDSQDYRDGNARWVETAAISRDPLASQPHFEVSQVSGADPVHVGSINTAGTAGNDLGDDWGLRDFQSIAVDACGRPHVVWAVDAGHTETDTATLDMPCSVPGVIPLATSAGAATTAPSPGLPNTSRAADDGDEFAGTVAVMATALLALRTRRQRTRRRSTRAVSSLPSKQR